LTDDYKRHKLSLVADTKLTLFRTSGSSTGSGGFRCELKANLPNMSLSPTVKRIGQ